MSIGLGQMLIGGLIGSQIGKSGGLMQMLGNKNNQEMPEEATHTMPDGTVMPGATHPQQTAQAPQGGEFMNGLNNMSQSQLAKLGLAFNSMRMHPDANLATSFRETIKAGGTSKQRNETVKYLRKMGFNNQADLVQKGIMSIKDASALLSKDTTQQGDVKGYISWLTSEAQKEGRAHFGDYAEMLTFNPSEDMMKEVTKMVANDLGYGDENRTISFSTPKVDQNTGEEYVVRTDPNQPLDKQVSIVKTGNILPTEEELRTTEAQAKFLESDKTRVQEVARDAFQQGQALEADVYNYKIALDTLVVTDENGVRKLRDEDKAQTGWLVTSFLPAMESNTALLRRVANVMGISVINMATFGALSEREMAMAMATNLDLMLPQQELVDYIDEMIIAKQKLARVMYDRVNEITYDPNLTYTEWMKKTTERATEHDDHRYHNLSKAQQQDLDDIVSEGNYAEGFNGRMLWNTFNLDQRKGFM